MQSIKNTHGNGPRYVLDIEHQLARPGDARRSAELTARDLEKQMEPAIWNDMLSTVGLLCATYLPLQFIALWRCRGAARVAAALPLLVMLPLIVVGLQPSNYRDGSLYKLGFFCPYLPVMIYLVAVLVDPRRPKTCPHCGHARRVASFQRMRSATCCDKCGKSPFESAAAAQTPASDPVTGPASNPEATPPPQ